MAEPDLAPLVLTGNDISLTNLDKPITLTEGNVDVDLLRRILPELPMQTRSRLNTQYGNVFPVHVYMYIYSHSMYSVYVCVLYVSAM